MKRLDWFKLLVDVMVVFLGVTAGFYLNNWQSEQVDRKQEQRFLSSFLIDVDNNIAELEKAIEFDSLKLVKLDSIAIDLKLQLDLKKVDQAIVQKVVEAVSNFYAQTMHRSTYESVISSGEFHLIRNYELRGSIVKYNFNIDEMLIVVNKHLDFFDKYIIATLFEEYDMVRAKFINPAFIYSHKFTNLFAHSYSISHENIRLCKEFLQESKNLRALLQKEVH